MKRSGAASIGAGLVGAAALGAWAYLLLGRGRFWRAEERDDRDQPAETVTSPSVVAVVPARDEVDVIARSIGGLLAQDYPGLFRVILVDDQSGDGTAEAARRTSRALGQEDRLTVLDGAAPPPGWTGKLWAVSQGIEAAGDPAYLLLTDADIGHAPDNLRRLVARAEAGQLALTSQMARLHCRTPAERALIPAFVFFFSMLYPFRWVNEPARRTAAAAGGVMLVRREALGAAGGIAAIRDALIDDCALGAKLKRQGPVWLGLTDRAVSLRPYQSAGEVGRMVSRSAYAQLGYSPVLLAGTVAGMGVLYAAPPLLALFGRGFARWTGAAAWAAMTVAFQPMLRFYRVSPAWGAALPAIGSAYTGFTVQSAIQVWRGQGGRWKGRTQARLGGPNSRAAALASGKDHTGENFPVASILIAPKHRASILAFYRFARAGDDVADHPTAPASKKLALLESLRATLAGESDAAAEALALRRAIADRPELARHGLDLLEAFRRDVTQTRYADWNALMDYCRWSAMPVGRFVLEVHGEDRETWAASDALCAALQVINHLQDCGKDYRAIDRVYVPLDALAAAGLGVEALGEERAGPALRGVIAELAGRTEALLNRSRPLAGQVHNLGLALEIGVIQRLAEDLNQRLERRDPLSERVHHGKAEMLSLAVFAAFAVLARRMRSFAG